MSSSVWIKANDVFEELTEENSRLFNELLFANTCLKNMIEFKVNFDLHSNKIRSVLISDEWQKFEQLNVKIQRSFSDYHSLCEASRKSRDIGVNQSVNSLAAVGNEDNRTKNYQSLSGISRLNPNLNVTQPNRSNDSSVSDDNGLEDSFDAEEDIKPVIIPNEKSNIRFTADGQPKIIRRRNRKKQPLDCTWPGCDYKAPAPIRLKTHLNEHKGIRPFACVFEGCGKSFTSKNYLRDHMKLHNDNDQAYKFVCEFDGCGKKFRKRYEFVHHKNRHLGNLQFECPMCPGKRFVSNKELQRHIKFLHKVLDQPLVCTLDDCNREFKTALAFRLHQSIKHLNKKKFVCEEPGCDYKSPLKISLIRHTRSAHTKERPFACHIPGCSKTFGYDRDVIEHVRRVHVTERNFSCSYEGCQKSYKTKKVLTLHIDKVHLGIKYPCDWPGCDYQSSTTGCLKTHKLIHIDERNFRCQWPECGKAFKSNTSLQEHIRTHTNDKPYACTWPGCNYRCTNSSNLCKHVKIHNKI